MAIMTYLEVEPGEVKEAHLAGSSPARKLLKSDGRHTRHEIDEDMTSEAIIAAALLSAPCNAYLRKPLIRRLYLIQTILIALIVYLPFWTILYLPRTSRPRGSWTLQRCLRVRWSRLLCGLVARCEIDYLGRDLNLDMEEPSTLTHSHPITIPSAPPKYLVGHIAETLAELHRTRGAWIPRMVHRVDPDAVGAWGRWNDGDKDKTYGFEPVKAFWFTGVKEHSQASMLPRQPGDPVGIHFHGGGYLCGTAAETDLTSSIPKNLVVHSPMHHILSVDYRLAPSSPWPLPLLDAISAYVYLVTIEGVAEGDIVLIGDSAGGHLSLALARYLRDHGKSLGLTGPRGLVLLSPWVDVGFTTAWGEGKYHNASSDLIDDTFGPFATSLLLRALPPNIMHTSAYLSPASLLLPSTPEILLDYPPIYLVRGTAERIETSIQIFWERLRLARKVQTDTWTLEDRHVKGIDCVHDFMIFPWQSAEAAEVYADMDVWLRELLSSGDEQGGSGSVTPTSLINQPHAIPTESPIPSPLSPDILPTSPTTTTNPRSPQDIKRRRSLRTAKSPVLDPIRPGVGRMMTDMRTEAMSYLDIPAMELISPLVLVGQVEGGEWDWEGEMDGTNGMTGMIRDGNEAGERKWYDVTDVLDREATNGENKESRKER